MLKAEGRLNIGWYYVTRQAYNRSNLFLLPIFFMPQQSRYNNNDVETIMNEVLLVLEKHQAKKDLSLMVLGNVISHILNHQVVPSERAKLANTFSRILQKTVTDE